LTFDAMDYATNGAGHPPDTNGDVGVDYYMEAVNTSIGIYTKTTGAKATAFTFNSFWSGAGTGTACDTSNQGDPIALYDTIGQRWIFMDFAWTNIQDGPYFFCFGVSQTSNPLGSYYRYAIRADDASHPWLPDYPKGGVWPDGLYFSAKPAEDGSWFGIDCQRCAGQGYLSQLFHVDAQQCARHAASSKYTELLCE
jgi:hypothetical protein